MELGSYKKFLHQDWHLFGLVVWVLGALSVIYGMSVGKFSLLNVLNEVVNIVNDQVYSNTQVSTQVTMIQHESTRFNTESIRPRNYHSLS